MFTDGKCSEIAKDVYKQRKEIDQTKPEFKASRTWVRNLSTISNGFTLDSSWMSSEASEKRRHSQLYSQARRSKVEISEKLHSELG
jgi:hypothetical protein